MLGKPRWGKKLFADTEPASTLPQVPPGEELAYAATAPQPLARMLDSRTTARGAVHDLTAEIRKDNRVCPMPQRWLDFYRLLEELSDGVPLPSAPLVGVAWDSTPALAKRMCFREQVEWAVANDRIIAAHTYLKSLRDTDWHYLG